MRGVVVVFLMLVGLVPRALAVYGVADFDVGRALQTIRYLSVAIGVRHGGSNAEGHAAQYLMAQLEQAGYRTVQQIPFSLPNGNTSHNVVADKPGQDDRIIVIGGHIDSRGPAPGANDNASGAAVVLEVARLMRDQVTHHTLRFIFFGSEEILDPHQQDGHHFGSRYYVSHLRVDERSRLDGMICVDAVANGSIFVIGNMEDGSSLAALLRRIAIQEGDAAVNQRDTGWSDHEAFEKAGIPVAYVRWRVDSHLHTAQDTMEYVHPGKVQTAGRVVLAACRGL